MANSFVKSSIIVLLFFVGFFAAEARRLPYFNTLKSSYPGQSEYGGLYSDDALLEDIGAANLTNKPNDTCSLRISTMLNLITFHTITRVPRGVKDNQYFTKTFKNEKTKSSVNIYFLLDMDALIAHLEKIYGIPLESDKPSDFAGRKGIMLMNITTNTHACRALLWDGYGFHQASGYLAHTNMSRVYFWQTPDESCSVNVKSDSSGLCFPSDATVELDTGRKVAMRDLQVGQRVKTIDTNGITTFTRVVTFLDKSHKHQGQYLTIFTQSGRQITMKPAHLIFRRESDVTSKKLFTSKAVYASALRPGDHIFTQQSGEVLNGADRVVGVALGDGKGAFAPVTNEGTLFVNGVLVSCFADLADHDLAHSLMSPFRVIYGLAPETLGAGGHHLHTYLKVIIRPIALRVLGEDKFFKGLFPAQNKPTKAIEDSSKEYWEKLSSANNSKRSAQRNK